MSTTTNKPKNDSMTRKELIALCKSLSLPLPITIDIVNLAEEKPYPYEVFDSLEQAMDSVFSDPALVLDLLKRPVPLGLMENISIKEWLFKSNNEYMTFNDGKLLILYKH